MLPLIILNREFVISLIIVNRVFQAAPSNPHTLSQHELLALAQWWQCWHTSADQHPHACAAATGASSSIGPAVPAEAGSKFHWCRGISEQGEGRVVWGRGGQARRHMGLGRGVELEYGCIQTPAPRPAAPIRTALFARGSRRRLCPCGGSSQFQTCTGYGEGTLASSLTAFKVSSGIYTFEKKMPNFISTWAKNVFIQIHGLLN